MFLDKIKKGQIPRAQRVVIYAPEGFGKSTIAAQFADPIFLDVEDSTSQMSVARLTRSDLPDLASVERATAEIVREKAYQTIVVDTFDWLETMAEESVIETQTDDKKQKVTSIEGFGFGKGFVMLRERLQVTLAVFDTAIRAGINVVVLAHSKISRFEPPDGSGGFNRYELKLSKHGGPLLSEWSDMLIFGNWKTQIREKDKNSAGEKYKGVGGRERILHAARCAAWDAKNRHGLADSEPWDIATFRRAFANAGVRWGGPQPERTVPTPEKSQDPKPSSFDQICEPLEDVVNAFLVSGNKIKPGQTWRDVSTEYRDRACRNPDAFLNAVNAFAPEGQQ
jgi:hypothetical protein